MYELEKTSLKPLKIKIPYGKKDTIRIKIKHLYYSCCTYIQK